MMQNFNFPIYKKRFESNLQAVFSYVQQVAFEAELKKAMLYNLENLGKNLRPILIYATCALLQKDLKFVDIPALSMEIIHTYSLIHDDLPEMDNDDYRRGKLTTHKVFSQAEAVLTGDALQSLAFELLSSKNILNNILEDAIIVKLVFELAKNAGLNGMAGGQSIDLSNKVDNFQDLQQMHNLKTGALIKTCVNFALLATNEQDKQKIKALQAFATNLGLAYQVYDDYLDATATSITLGKTANKDKDNNKSTFVKFLGLEKTLSFANELATNAKDSLKIFDNNQEMLYLVDYIVKRDK